MKAVLFGATRGIGRAIARELAGRGEALFLLGRDGAELARSASDLQLRGARATGFAHCDLFEPAGFEPALARAEASFEGFDVVVMSAGVQYPQETLEGDVSGATA